MQASCEVTLWSFALSASTSSVMLREPGGGTSRSRGAHLICTARPIHSVAMSYDEAQMSWMAADKSL